MNHLSTECEQNLRGWAAPKRQEGKQKLAKRVELSRFSDLVGSFSLISHFRRGASDMGALTANQRLIHIKCQIGGPALSSF